MILKKWHLEHEIQTNGIWNITFKQMIYKQMSVEQMTFKQMPTELMPYKKCQWNQ
jgi:hypothetical protein